MHVKQKYQSRFEFFHLEQKWLWPNWHLAVNCKWSLFQTNVLNFCIVFYQVKTQNIILSLTKHFRKIIVNSLSNESKKSNEAIFNKNLERLGQMSFALLVRLFCYTFCFLQCAINSNFCITLLVILEKIPPLLSCRFRLCPRGVYPRRIGSKSGESGCVSCSWSSGAQWYPRVHVTGSRESGSTWQEFWKKWQSLKHSKLYGRTLKPYRLKSLKLKDSLNFLKSLRHSKVFKISKTLKFWRFFELYESLNI